MSSGAQRALEQARGIARRLRHESVGAEHIVLALLEPGGPAEPVLAGLGLQVGEVRGRLQAAGRRGKVRAGEELAYTSHAKRLIEVASREAREAGSGLTAEHLLLAAFEEPRGTMAKLLADHGIASAAARAAVTAGAGGREEAGSAKSPAKRARTAPPPPRSIAPPTKPRWRLTWQLALLPMVPASIVLGYIIHAPGAWVFITACLAVLPLASYMGEATEHLAHRTNPTIGGLLNATFGNAAELIISIAALRAGLVELVKASITGSILGNLLLIMGLAILAGGTARPELRFNRTNAGMSAGMLALSVVALVFPALYHAVHPEGSARIAELRMSEAVAVILLATYGCSLLFTLKTHRRLFGGEPHPMEAPVWGVGKSIAILALATAAVALESELLVHAAGEATEAMGLSTVFLGLIIIPIIGNAAEHAAAVVLSRKGQVDLGLQIALGSSTQIALLVAPLLVFIGLALGQEMNLVFRPFEVVALAMATVVTAILTLDGESHWFEGVQLLAVYGLVAVGAFFLN